MPTAVRKWYILLIVLLWTAPGWAHGVEGVILPAQGYLLTAHYDDGEPMSYAEVQIQAPDANLAFQTGRTDRNGRLMFQPDRSGRWQVEVKDGMGHRAAFDVAVADGPPQTAPVAPPGTAGSVSRGQAAVTGLAIIFGLTGVCYGWRARQREP
jgi:nickel transport protein